MWILSAAIILEAVFISLRLFSGGEQPNIKKTQHTQNQVRSYPATEFTSGATGIIAEPANMTGGPILFGFCFLFPNTHCVTIHLCNMFLNLGTAWRTKLFLFIKGSLMLPWKCLNSYNEPQRWSWLPYNGHTIKNNEHDRCADLFVGRCFPKSGSRKHRFFSLFLNLGVPWTSNACSQEA